MTKGFTAVLLLAAAAIPVPGFAADADLPVPIQQYEGVRYYSGGVGLEERRELPQRFPLKVVFVTDTGKLLCGAEVTITAKGKVLFQGSAANGPWLVVDLPAGTYDIVAVQDGTKRGSKSVRIAAGRQRTVILRWKTGEVNMGLGGPNS